MGHKIKLQSFNFLPKIIIYVYLFIIILFLIRIFITTLIALVAKLSGVFSISFECATFIIFNEIFAEMMWYIIE